MCFYEPMINCGIEPFRLHGLQIYWSKRKFFAKEEGLTFTRWFGNRHGCHSIVLGHQHEELH